MQTLFPQSSLNREKERRHLRLINSLFFSVFLCKINTYFFEKFCDNIFVINNSHKIKKQTKL